MPNYQQIDTRKANPLLPLIGFIIILAFGGFAYLVSPAVGQWLSTTNWTVVGTSVLPMRFPAGWSEVTVRLAISSGIFLVLFVLAMILMFLVMGTSRSETDISLGELRAEKASKGRRRRRR